MAPRSCYPKIPNLCRSVVPHRLNQDTPLFVSFDYYVDAILI